MCKSNDKKVAQLGMPVGTASNRLRKSIIFNFLKKLNENFCFQCGSEITSENELSIEHKVPYLDSEDPIDLFFNLDNIAFSHLTCNVGAARQPRKLTGLDDLRMIHGSINTYNLRGCRCEKCVEVKKLFNAKRKPAHGKSN